MTATQRKGTQLLSPELPRGSRLLVGAVGHMRDSALLAGLCTFKEAVTKSISNGAFGARNRRSRVTARNARRNSEQALQLPCRTLHKKKKIRRKSKRRKKTTHKILASRRREKRWDEIEIGMARRQAIQGNVPDYKNKRESVEKNMEKDGTHQKRS